VGTRKEEGTREHGEKGRRHFKREKSTRTGELIKAWVGRANPPKTAGRIGQSLLLDFGFRKWTASEFWCKYDAHMNFGSL